MSITCEKQKNMQAKINNSRIAQPILGIVVPCFNEEAVLRETTSRLLTLLKKMQQDGLISTLSAIFYVDDGSCDGTWKLIEELSLVHPEICGIKLSRNYGHQNALLCGLMTAPGHVLVSVDADLQDDLNVILEMVRHYQDGCEIVYGVRRSRNTDTLFKRITAEGYYALMAAMKVDIVFNHADYRLLSRRALDALSEYREVNLFLRGIVRLLGYKSEVVLFDRSPRFAGESKYPLRKMLSFAWQGITSFSTAPLRMITISGIMISCISIIMAAWGFWTALMTNKALPGWASTVVPMYFLGGFQLLSLGIIGEYVAKIYLECKKRPKFHIDTLTGASFSSEFKHCDVSTNTHNLDQ